MQHKDFVRRLPTKDGDLQKKKVVSMRVVGLDPLLLLLLIILTVVGLFVLYSASGRSMDAIYKQSVFIASGYVVMWGMSNISLSLLRIWAPILYVFGMLLLVMVLLFGVHANGAQRWLNLGFTRFQPSELVKLFVPMFVAWYLSKKDLPPRFKDIIIVIAIVLSPAALIIQQPDLGTAILVAVAGLFVLWLAGLSFAYIFAAMMVLVASAYPLWHFLLHDYQKRRILTLIDPTSDKLGAGWNTIQATTAIGSGGIEGKGWLEGTQSHLDFLPESHTDFIIAVLAEEFGLIGVACLLGVYFLLVMRSLYISWRCSMVFGQLLGGAIALTFFVYVVVNMGMVAGVLPIVGVPLPLISQGGTSIVSLFISFGILMLIAKSIKPMSADNT